VKLTLGAVIKEPGSSTRYETSGWGTFSPEVDAEKCTGCGLCYLHCPDAAIVEGKPPKIDYRYCKGCGICANVCPTKAIKMVQERSK
jgi:pyruvate ferredoxin oxidoreductase delta subunit